MSESGLSLKDKKSKSALIIEQRFTNTSSKPTLIGEVPRNLVELSSLNEETLITLMLVMNNFDEINNFFHEQLSEQNQDLREAHMKSFNEMEEWKRF